MRRPGRFPWKTQTLKARLLPGDNADMAVVLAELEAADLIRAFSHGGKPFGAVRNFRKYQRPKRPSNVHTLPAELHTYVGLSGDTSPPIPHLFSHAEETSAQREEGEEEGGEEIKHTARDDEAAFEEFWSSFDPPQERPQARGAARLGGDGRFAPATCGNCWRRWRAIAPGWRSNRASRNAIIRCSIRRPGCAARCGTGFCPRPRRGCGRGGGMHGRARRAAGGRDRRGAVRRLVFRRGLRRVKRRWKRSASPCRANSSANGSWSISAPTLERCYGAHVVETA